MNARQNAHLIFDAALQAASIPAAFERHFPALPPCEHIYAIALGKAALPMLESLCDHLPRPLTAGVCCAPVLLLDRIPQVEYFSGGHPLPNEDSFASARAALALLQRTGPRDLVFFLISGGGSAMFELPLDPGISLEDTRSLYQTLVGSGATIAEINTVRKHFSAVKGGRLAAHAAHRFSFLVSDVAPRYLDALASGPTLPDSSTVAECRAILHRYDLRRHCTPRVQAFFDDPGLPETPTLQEAPIATLLSSDDLLDAARAQAQALGYDVVIDNDCDDWDYADAADYLLARYRALRREYPRLCLLSGGEVTVRLGKHPGVGGRNQQFALACALRLE
jgi:glycerate 2-kinase